MGRKSNADMEQPHLNADQNARPGARFHQFRAELCGISIMKQIYIDFDIHLSSTFIYAIYKNTLGDHGELGFGHRWRGARWQFQLGHGGAEGARVLCVFYMKFLREIGFVIPDILRKFLPIAH